MTDWAGKSTWGSKQTLISRIPSQAPTVYMAKDMRCSEAGDGSMAGMAGDAMADEVACAQSGGRHVPDT